MQKGFITLPILLIVLLGTALVGGGGYTIYKINKIEADNKQKVSELESKLNEVATSSLETKTEEFKIELSTTSESGTQSIDDEIVVSEPTNIQFSGSAKMPEVAPVSIDLCGNINGVQTVIPVGFVKVGSNCEQLEDKCTNIDGIQSAVPSGMLVFKGYGCMTEKEMDKISDTNREAGSAQREADKLAQECAELKKSVYQMDQQIIDIQEKYRIQIDKIYSGAGQTKSQANAEASNIYSKQSSEIAPIEAERNKLANEYNYLCVN